LPYRAQSRDLSINLLLYKLGAEPLRSGLRLQEDI
jgi:hypothetical protein